MSDAGYAFPGWRSPWYGNVQQRILLDHPISIDAFRDFIYISRTGAITELSEDQWMELRRRIEKINPGLDLSIEIKRTWSKVGKEGMKE